MPACTHAPQRSPTATAYRVYPTYHTAPGTGKTLLAKAAATETGATFIELKISDVVRGEIGESEKVSWFDWTIGPGLFLPPPVFPAPLQLLCGTYCSV